MAELIKLLKPVPKLVLKSVGATPKPTNPVLVPVENALLKALARVPVLTTELKGFVKSAVGSVRFRRFLNAQK